MPMAKVNSLGLVFQTPVSIENVGATDVHQAVYSITGMRLAGPQLGINIINNNFTHKISPFISFVK